VPGERGNDGDQRGRRAVEVGRVDEARGAEVRDEEGEVRVGAGGGRRGFDGPVGRGEVAGGDGGPCGVEGLLEGGRRR
jgi:hypothetical protein